MGRRATLFLTLFVLTATAWAQQKKRVAVLNFDYSTVSNSVTSIFGSNVDVGKGIADLLVEELVKGGVYSVIERKELDKILAEQNFSNSDRADQASAAKLARVLGVDSIIIGSITQFGRDDTSTKSNIPGLGRIGIGGVSKREAKAAVAITARIVSTDTAEILAVATGKGASVKSGTSLIGSSSGSAVDMTSSNFAGTILWEAVHEAVSSAAKQINQDAASLPTRTIQVDGLVADATAGILVMNVGTKGGVKVGDRLQIKRASREVRDPVTGKVIRRIEENIGEVAITEVDENSSVGTYTGSIPAKIGDRVSSTP